ncbi:conserved Plasmodium protein, unknown function [Plasmodium malariae]|uniref:Dynein attachment factor N-terminal domain-containing protein n=1 Tax=Plasmodium malariae TaxID=5858 RepID=A0A1C3KXY8_PLAMA|nr:conserved Plasmodium protein, unknown function [Plasmodium malariae]
MIPSNDSALINIKKMRNDFVRSIVKDEEYKKKDDKKKEIVKSCKSYKDFCNIVSCVSMKPVRKYEEKVTYEDYVNFNFSSHNSKIESTKKKNRKNYNFFVSRQFKLNNQMDEFSPLNYERYKTRREIEQFLYILNDHKDNYDKFIKDHYNCDDMKDIISFIKNKWELLFDSDPALAGDDRAEDHETREENNQLNDENCQANSEEQNFKILNLVNFLFWLCKRWCCQNFSAYFTQDELADINANVHIITQRLENVNCVNNYKDNKIIEMINYIKKNNF